MKKLLSILGAAGLVVTTSAVLVSCGSDNDSANSESKVTVETFAAEMNKLFKESAKDATQYSGEDEANKTFLVRTTKEVKDGEQADLDKKLEAFEKEIRTFLGEQAQNIEVGTWPKAPSDTQKGAQTGEVIGFLFHIEDKTQIETTFGNGFVEVEKSEFNNNMKDLFLNNMNDAKIYYKGEGKDTPKSSNKVIVRSSEADTKAITDSIDKETLVTYLGEFAKLVNTGIEGVTSEDNIVIEVGSWKLDEGNEKEENVEAVGNEVIGFRIKLVEENVALTDADLATFKKDGKFGEIDFIKQFKNATNKVENLSFFYQA